MNKKIINNMEEYLKSIFMSTISGDSSHRNHFTISILDPFKKIDV